MPSKQDEAEVSEAFNPDEIDIQDVVNSFTAQIAEQASKIAAEQARNRKLSNELARVNAENVALHALVRKTAPQHNGRTTTTKSKAKKGK